MRFVREILESRTGETIPVIAHPNATGSDLLRLAYDSARLLSERPAPRSVCVTADDRRVAVSATRAEPSSIVVGIYGPWGDGKASVRNMMTEALASHSNVIVVALIRGISRAGPNPSRADLFSGS